MIFFFKYTSIPKYKSQVNDVKPKIIVTAVKALTFVHCRFFFCDFCVFIIQLQGLTLAS